MLILFRKCSTARPAEVNLLCLKLLFTPQSSYWCIGEALSQPEQSSSLSFRSLCTAVPSADTFSHKWKVAGVQRRDLCSAGVWGAASAALLFFFSFSFELGLRTETRNCNRESSLPNRKGSA